MGAAPPIRLHSQSSPPEPTPSTMRPPPPSRCDTASLGGRHQAGVTPRHLVARRRAGGDSHAGHPATAVPGGGSVAPWCRHKRPNTPLVAPCTLLGPHRRSAHYRACPRWRRATLPQAGVRAPLHLAPAGHLAFRGAGVACCIGCGRTSTGAIPVGLESVRGGNACRGRPPEGLANSRATALLSSHRSLGLEA